VKSEGEKIEDRLLWGTFTITLKKRFRRKAEHELLKSKGRGKAKNTRVYIRVTQWSKSRNGLRHRYGLNEKNVTQKLGIERGKRGIGGRL